MLVRPPRHPALQQVVSLLWVGVTAERPWALERIVPTGQVHLSWRVCGAPIRLGADGGQVERFGVVGGARIAAHVHDTPGGARSIGALLRAGASPRLFGEAARTLAGRHVGLDAVWAGASDLQDRLAELPDGPALDALELALVGRLRPAARPPGLAAAMEALDRGVSVGEVARAIGRSPRAIGLWFDDAVGISPASWSRVRRLQRALDLAEREADWSEVARGAGYFDQPHLCREFRSIAGITPSAWRAHVRGDRNHVPVASDPSKPGAVEVG